MRYNCHWFSDWRGNRQSIRRKRLSEWRPKFAWFPKSMTTDSRDCRWLEWVERRLVTKTIRDNTTTYLNEIYSYWEYRPINDVPKTPTEV